MRVSLFDFDLPDELVAIKPLPARDASRMLVVQPDTSIEHSRVAALPTWLRPGDVLVLNDTKVMPARLFATRGAAKIELLLHQQRSETQWCAFAKPAKRLHVGDVLMLENQHEIEVMDKLPDGQVLLDMRLGFEELSTLLQRCGHIPLPPYIQKHRVETPADSERYQTVFAQDNKQRSVAAPTAGLHFTEELLAACEAAGAMIVRVTLHVGAGTFLPVKVGSTDEHVMHEEHWQVSEEAADVINLAKERGGRVIAVGTTSVRTLESAAKNGRLQAGSGTTTIFITPGYEFQMVDVMLTNFHLPKSTLFMLVSAFCGLDTMQNAYAQAIQENYRFYSYGDACLLHSSKGVL